jgi:DNA (cytosine-5)-methyltransferase 1
MIITSRKAPPILTFVDVFAGCGGLSLGLFEAGLQGVFAIEQDSLAFETLSANLLRAEGRHCYSWPDWLPREAMAIDFLLRHYKKQLTKMRGTVDILVGGPPCQGFSSAGRRQHDDPRNSLFQRYLEIVKLLEPKIVLMENVRGFTTDFGTDSPPIQNYSVALRQSLSANYEVYEDLFNLADFGVPQTRTRYFLLALKPGVFQGNPLVKLREGQVKYRRDLGLPNSVSSSMAISDLERSRCGVQQSSDYPRFQELRYQKPMTRYQKLMRRGTRTMSDVRLANHSEKIVRRFAELIALSHSSGRLGRAIGSEIRAKFGLKKTAIRVLDPDRPSPTITSMPDDLLHYREPRTLTVRENARLQSFPDWFQFKGKYTTGGDRRRKEVPRFTQVANAVPPLAARNLLNFY